MFGGMRDIKQGSGVRDQRTLDELEASLNGSSHCSTLLATSSVVGDFQAIEDQAQHVLRGGVLFLALVVALVLLADLLGGQQDAVFLRVLAKGLGRGLAAMPAAG